MTLLLVFQMRCFTCQKAEVGSPICYSLFLTTKLVVESHLIEKQEARS